MGDEAFQTKKNEPTHISLHCLEQAVCCIMYCNSGPNFPRSPADLNAPPGAECVNVSDIETLVGHITMKPRWLSESADE